MARFSYNAVDLIALGMIAGKSSWGCAAGMAGELFRLLCTALVLAMGWRYYAVIGDQLAAHTRLSASPEMLQAARLRLDRDAAGRLQRLAAPDRGLVDGSAFQHPD